MFLYNYVAEVTSRQFRNFSQEVYLTRNGILFEQTEKKEATKRRMLQRLLVVVVVFFVAMAMAQKYPKVQFETFEMAKCPVSFSYSFDLLFY